MPCSTCRVVLGAMGIMGRIVGSTATGSIATATARCAGAMVIMKTSIAASSLALRRRARYGLSIQAKRAVSGVPAVAEPATS